MVQNYLKRLRRIVGAAWTVGPPGGRMHLIHSANGRRNEASSGVAARRLLFNVTYRSPNPASRAKIPCSRRRRHDRVVPRESDSCPPRRPPVGKPKPTRLHTPSFVLNCLVLTVGASETGRDLLSRPPACGAPEYHNACGRAAPGSSHSAEGHHGSGRDVPQQRAEGTKRTRPGDGCGRRTGPTPD